jgi:hypothetical protein
VTQYGIIFTFESWLACPGLTAAIDFPTPPFAKTILASPPVGSLSSGKNMSSGHWPFVVERGGSDNSVRAEDQR